MNNLVSAIRIACRYKNVAKYTECKRFAGHSKWANIKHIKAAKDGQKHLAMIQIMRHVKIAIAEGKSAKPEENSKLAKLIENAKKQSLPVTTIKTYLEKVQNSKTKTESFFIESRGPSGSIILVHMITDNFVHTRNTVNSYLKKLNFKNGEVAAKPSFDCKGIIITETGNKSLDKATEDAIEVGAEEAEKGEHDGKEFFEFTCHSRDLDKVKTALEEKNYAIVEADVQYIPKVCVTLSDADIDRLDKLYGKLNTIEEVYKIYNNVA